MSTNEKLEALTTIAEVRDLVVQTLDASKFTEEFDIDAIADHLWDNRHTGNVEDFWDVVAEHEKN
jgi:hypothetical protein